MAETLCERTSTKLKFLLRSPVTMPSPEDLEEWQTSAPLRRDEHFVAAVARQLKQPDQHFNTMWGFIGDSFRYHLEEIVRSPAPEMFETKAHLIAEESFHGLDRWDLMPLFEDAGWGDFKLSGRYDDLGSLLRTEGQKRTERLINQMLTRWHDRDYWSVQWRSKPREIDLTEREERRRRRLSGDHGFTAPAVRDYGRF